MNQFKIFILSGVITALCSHLAWAGTINSISVNEEARTVTVSLALCESSLDEPAIQTTVEGGTFMASLTAYEDTVISCDSKFLVIFNIPACTEFSETGAFLYAPDGHDAMSSNMGMGVDDATCVSVQSNFLVVTGAPAGKETYDACDEACSDYCWFGTCGGNLYDTCMDGCQADNTKSVIDTEPVIFAVPEVQCTPETLNIKSKGKWITCSVQSTSADGDFSLNDDSGNSFAIDPSLSMNGNTLLVKFGRQALIDEITSSESSFPPFVSFTRNGLELDTIKLINPGKGKN